MKKNIIKAFLIVLVAVFTNVAFAQEETEEKEAKPVRDPFNSSLLIDNQTVVTPYAKQLEFLIYHRMGSIDNGLTDLFGIYGVSNIKLALQYGITEKLMIGIGTEKNNKLNDLYAKYLIIEQTRTGSIPVSVSAFGNIAVDARDEEAFGANYEFTDRLSYFAQVIVSRKFSNDFSLLFAPSYSHFNSVKEEFQHDRIGTMLGGRYKFAELMGVIFEYHHPFNINPVRDYQNEINPGASLGLEIGTITHSFQIFASNYQDILPQKNYVFNTSEFDSESIIIGFNVNVKF